MAVLLFETRVARDSLPHAIDALIPSLQMVDAQSVCASHPNLCKQEGQKRGKVHCYLDDLTYPECEFKGLSAVD